MTGGKRTGSGRRAVTIDPAEVERLCALQCTHEELAAWFKVSVRTIERRAKQPAFAQAMAQGAQAGALGSFHSAALRSGSERLEIRRLPSASGPGPVLVVGGADTGRPGLARLQIERAAARLSAA